MKKVCLIIGAGAGIGGSVGAKFAANGYHAALCRRSDAEGLQNSLMALNQMAELPQVTCSTPSKRVLSKS